jgi:hypothetical protein
MNRRRFTPVLCDLEQRLALNATLGQPPAVDPMGTIQLGPAALDPMSDTTVPSSSPSLVSPADPGDFPPPTPPDGPALC